MKVSMVRRLCSFTSIMLLMGLAYGQDKIQKARIIDKPQPRYTAEAETNRTEGTVILRAIFRASGEVTDIKPIQTLPDGLTESAVQAAKSIKFEPAMKNGKPASEYVRIEYNFRLR